MCASDWRVPGSGFVFVKASFANRGKSREVVESLSNGNPGDCFTAFCAIEIRAASGTAGFSPRASQRRNGFDSHRTGGDSLSRRRRRRTELPVRPNLSTILLSYADQGSLV